MRTLLRGNVKMALGSVRATRWRSLLTTMGVIIGVLSVVTIVSIGEGIKQQISGQISHLGKDLITIRPGNLTNQSTTQTLGSLNILSNLNGTSTLSAHDLSVVNSTPNLKLAVPLAVVPGTIVGGNGQQYTSGIVIGATQGIPTVLNQSLAYGDFYDNTDDEKPVAVIGANVAQQLFGSEAPLGHPFTFDGETFIVDGVFNPFDTVPFSLDTDFNNVIFIPYVLAQQLNHNSLPIYEILVKPSNPGLTNSLAQALNQNLLSAHGGQQNFSVLKQNQSLMVTNNVLNLLTTLIGGIAAISLAVGGIGIMNVMLVSVTERTHEIGIRKAIGATSRQVLGQFLIEAAVLSAVGGVIGVLLSLLVNGALRALTDLTPVISWRVMLLAVSVSLVVGIIFGITPALKAAHKDPIDALRHE
jgi:putative ABC transport system permease protein